MPQNAMPVRSYIFSAHPEVFVNNFRSIQTLHSCHRCCKGSRVYITKHPLQITLKIDEYVMGSACYSTEVGCSLNSAGQRQKAPQESKSRNFCLHNSTKLSGGTGMCAKCTDLSSWCGECENVCIEETQIKCDFCLHTLSNVASLNDHVKVNIIAL